MKHKALFFTSLVVFALSVFILFYGLFVHNILLALLGVVGSLAGFVFLAGSYAYKKNWRCDKCKKVLSIDVWTYLISSNGRRNQKKLFCPNCGRKTWCTGESE